MTEPSEWSLPRLNANDDDNIVTEYNTVATARTPNCGKTSKYVDCQCRAKEFTLFVDDMVHVL